MAVTDQSRWRYVMTDMSGNPKGFAFNATGKQWGYHINAGRTAQFTINIDNPVANFILNNDSLMKVYRKTRTTNAWQLLMVGDTVQVEESAQGDVGLLTVVATDPWARLQARLIGMAMNSIGQGTGFTDGTVTSLVDLGQILADILAYLNSVAYTGIEMGSLTGSTTSYIGPVYAQAVGDMFQQICNTLGGPNFEIVPVEPTGGAMPYTTIGVMNVTPTLGTYKPNTIFDYGTGKFNVQSYDRILSKDGLANMVYSPPQGFPSLSAAGDGMITASDSTSINALGMYEAIADTDVITPALRQELCNETLAIRKQARQQITFTPTVDCPYDYGVDYDVGDIVVSRAYVNGGYRYNGTTEIYGVDISVDDQDAESPTLTLIPTTT